MTAARDRAQRTVDATFREHGVPASYFAPASMVAIPCTIIVSDEDRQVQFGGTSRPVAEGGRFELRASEVAAPLKGGALSLLNDVGTEVSRHAIVGDPTTDDPFRLVWLCTVRP